LEGTEGDLIDILHPDFLRGTDEWEAVGIVAPDLADMNDPFVGLLDPGV